MITSTFPERRTSDLLRQSRGIRFLGLSDDMICCVRTESKISYEIVVAARKNHIAAIATNGGPSDWCTGLGAMARANASKMTPELISEGYHLRFTQVDGESTVTDQIVAVAVITNPFRAQAMRELAHARWLPTQAACQLREEERLAEHFAKEELLAVEWILRLFSPKGRQYARNFLIAAREIGRLNEAIDALSNHYTKYWIYQDSRIAGMILNDKDAERWEWAHLEAGVPYGT